MCPPLLDCAHASRYKAGAFITYMNAGINGGNTYRRIVEILSRKIEKKQRCLTHRCSVLIKGVISYPLCDFLVFLAVFDFLGRGFLCNRGLCADLLFLGGGSNGDDLFPIGEDFHLV